MSAFWFALGFLTRVPTPALDFSNREAQARALAEEATFERMMDTAGARIQQR